MHLSLSIAVLALGPWSLDAHGADLFQTPLQSPAAGDREPSLVAAGHFDRDGRLDLVTANGTGVITLHFQDAADRGSWSHLIFSIPTPFVSSLIAGDFDADGCDDLVIASPARLFRCRGDGSFAPWTELQDAQGVRAMAAGDFNGDRRLDIAVSIPTPGLIPGQILVYLNDGGGQFSRAGNPLLIGATRIEAADWSGDGAPDLVTNTGSGVELFRGRGDGTFDPSGGPVPNLGCLTDFAIGDLNHDGKADLAGLCNGSQASRGFTAGISRGDGPRR
jgi:hypothetical protein